MVCMASEVIYFLSDTHLGDGTGADRFLYPDQLRNLLGKIESERRAHLVLLGDFLELWACGLEAIMLKRADIFHSIGRIAAQHKVTYVVGNHDCLPWYYYLGMQVGRIRIQERFEHQNGKVVALHGHQFDPFNRVDVETDGRVQVPWTRKLVQAIGLVERIGGDPAGNAIADASEFLSSSAAAVEEIFRRQSPGERGYPLQERIYDDAAYSLMRQGARFVLMGHTHHPVARQFGLKLYVNTGSWVWERYPPTYGRLAAGKLQLLDANTHQPYAG